MTDIRLIIDDMRRSVDNDNLSRECGASGHRVMAWVHSLESYERQTSQESTGNAGSGSFGVKSTVSLLELRDKITKQLDRAIEEMRATPWWRPFRRVDASLVAMVWFQAFWIVDGKITELQHEGTKPSS